MLNIQKIENILKQVNNDRMSAKKVIISILNGGFFEKYHDDTNLNKFLKNIEKESKMLHEYFFKLIKELMMKRFIIIRQNHFQDYENQLLMFLYDYFSFKKNKNDEFNI